MDFSSEALRIAFVPIFIFLHRYNEILRIPCLTVIRNGAKSGNCVPGPEGAPRGTKSTIFAKGIFRPFNLPKIFPNSVGDLRFYTSNVRYANETRLKLENFSELEVGMFRAAHQDIF